MNAIFFEPKKSKKTNIWQFYNFLFLILKLWCATSESSVVWPMMMMMMMWQREAKVNVCTVKMCCVTRSLYSYLLPLVCEELNDRNLKYIFIHIKLWQKKWNFAQRTSERANERSNEWANDLTLKSRNVWHKSIHNKAPFEFDEWKFFFSRFYYFHRVYISRNMCVSVKYMENAR